MPELALNVIDTGNPDGPPAVFIHGFMSSRLQWDRNLGRLGTELRIVLVELPGHGDSPPPADPSGFSPRIVLPAIDRVRQELGIDRWWVIGHSLGGAVGIRYVLEHPHRTEGLIFTNSRAAFGIERPASEPSPPVRPTSPDDLRSVPFHPVHAKRFPADLKRRMVAVADAMDPSVVTDVGRTANEWRSREQLHHLAVPVLLINGRWESAFQPHVEAARRSIAGLRVVDLDGGHSINIEQAEGFDRAVLEFVADNAGP